MYMMIRKYYIIPGTVGQWMQRVQEGLMPLVREVPGFIAYYDLEVRDDEVVSISIFETQAGAEASRQRATTWFLEQLAPLLQTFPEITAGQVRAASEPVYRSPPSQVKGGDKHGAPV